VDDQLRRSKIFIVPVTQKRKAPLGAAYEVVPNEILLLRSWSRFFVSSYKDLAPTEPFFDNLFRLLGEGSPGDLRHRQAPRVRFLAILLVVNGNLAISGALNNDAGLHAALGCYVSDGPAHVRSYAVRQFNSDRVH
jgi:hypothetical protein